MYLCEAILLTHAAESSSLKMMVFSVMKSNNTEIKYLYLSATTNYTSLLSSTVIWDL